MFFRVGMKAVPIVLLRGYGMKPTPPVIEIKVAVRRYYTSKHEIGRSKNS